MHRLEDAANSGFGLEVIQRRHLESVLIGEVAVEQLLLDGVAGGDG
jgi:hypothetical protein